MLIPVVACAILFVTYVVIAIGRAPFLRVDRTGAAIVGATLMIATGVISLEQAYAAIDFRTLILLFGMMVLIAHLRMAGFFRLVVRAVAQRIHEPRLLLVAVVFVNRSTGTCSCSSSDCSSWSGESKKPGSRRACSRCSNRSACTPYQG